VGIDQLFQQAVALIGAGEVPALERLLTDHPELARERLTAPGPWLRDKVGDALDGSFKEPYLPWFVAEDAPVHGCLPENIAEVTRNRPSADLYAHGTPLHHAVCSGSLATVRALVEAGADPGSRDTAWNGIPLGWAEYHLAERKDADSQRRYREIAAYLRDRRPPPPA
jgi:peptide-methionine (S)-S-oxide reductase